MQLVEILDNIGNSRAFLRGRSVIDHSLLGCRPSANQVVPGRHELPAGWRYTTACRGGDERGHLEPRAAPACAAPVATERGRAERPPHRHLPRMQPVAPMREHHRRCPRLPRGVVPVRHYTTLRHKPVVAHGSRNDAITSQFLVRRCRPGCPLFASRQ